MSFFAIGCILFAATSAQATDQYWDTNGLSSGLGGTGTWNTSVINLVWNDSTGTGIPAAWTNGNNAFFSGTAGTATVGAAISAGQINLTVSGYIIAATGGNTLTLTSTGTGTSSAINATNTSGTNTISSAVILGAAAGTTQTFTQSAGGTLAISGVISNTNAISGLTLAGSGTYTFSGTNTYTAATTINASTLSVSSLANGGSNSNIGASTNAATNLVLNGGTLQYTGAAASTDRLFSVGTSGGTIDASGSGAVNFTNTGSMGFNSQTGTRTLTLTGTNTGSNTLAAVIGDNSGATSLTKSGTGTWVLSGANTYTGATAINAGTLSLDSAGSTTARLANTSGITVNSGGTLLLANSSGTTSTDRINNSATVTINGGGTFKTGGLSEGNGAAGMGALTLQNTSPSSHVTIDFGSTTAGSSLVFSSLSAASKGAYVDILNWGGTAWTDNGATTNDRLLFATDPGFTATDLANFAFSGYATGAVEIVYGNLWEICPVPEPSTWLAGFLALAALGYQQRRRLLAVLHGK